MVAGICAARGIPHVTLPVAVPANGNLQANARTARYQALAGWMHRDGLVALVTAHHADDQAETLLMRLNRGAGVRGLAAMRAAVPLPGAPGLALLRPLLGWRKQELRDIVQRAKLMAAEDPSNENAVFERVRVRQALDAAHWLDPSALAASAVALGDADDAVEWAAQREWADAVSADGEGLAYCADASCPPTPRAIRLRILERVIRELGGTRPRGAEVARWLASLEAGRTATLGGVKGRPTVKRWHFTVAAPHRGTDRAR